MQAASTALIAGLGSVVFSLAACSAEPQSQASGSTSSVLPLGQLGLAANAARSGRSPRFLRLAPFAQPVQHGLRSAKERIPKDLYVSSLFPDEVVVLRNTTYKNVSTITKGLVSPNGDFVDATGKLYVADYDGIDIQEYEPGRKSPSFTYKNGMIDPVDVSVDSHGNVYEADYDGLYVNEYAQRSNTVLNSCSPGGGVEGVAEDANGDVFVAYNQNASGSGKIAEYKSGLDGCHEKVLKVSLAFAGGMVLDAQGNLIVADQNAPAVDVIAPPYSRIKRKLGSGYLGPFHVTLDKANKLAFVSDYYDVFVVDYPSGSLAATLGSGLGWEVPAGAVDSENAVY
jgi:hypothetical protein